MLGRVILLCGIIILAQSCTKHSEIKFTDNAFYINPESTGLSDYRIEKWRVGPLRKQELSKGVTVFISFPQLKRPDLEKLISKYGIDSWLVKVRKRSFSVNTVLGYLYIPLVIPGTQGRNKHRRHQIKKGAFSIYYSAAAISKRFEGFECPAFEHDRYIDKVEIHKRALNLDQIYAGALEESYIGPKVTEFGYSGNILNGGASIEGEYTVEIALYNHKNKKKKSNYIELVESANITSEKRRQISGCEGFKIPTKEEDVDKMKLFRWN
ncbi:MAG: hypothetical protein BM556_07950 [Bacteriovorax sp. MedPE-SWde]|nr:MAG: hypothetical protein BM556_07950 [Bacteriovorax sp. MedPE-SWde]